MLLQRIKYFIAVAEHNSFTEAAEQCYISQSAISQQINALESELGVKEDTREAVKCFKTAAEKCSSGVAYHNLGICYENGFGVRKDYKKAIEMYRRAVENGKKAGLEGIKNVYAKMNKQTT